jgi:hypothetical protein
MTYFPTTDATFASRGFADGGPRDSRDATYLDTTPDEAAVLERLAALSRWLDHAFRLPGTDIRFGLDAIVGMIPGVGDVLTNLISAYLVVEARRLGVTRWDMARMIGNIVVDAGLSAVPIAGDIFDVFWRANDRNMRILLEHLARRGRVIDGEAVRVD